MPRKFTSYEPDAIDCATVQSAIGNDFGLYVEVTTSYALDRVTVIAKCRPVCDYPAGVVQVQALVTAPLKTAKSLYVMQYAAMLDCWHQCDRGVLGVAQTAVQRGWDGRPYTPAKRKA